MESVEDLKQSIHYILQWSFFMSGKLLCPTLQPHGLQHYRLPCPSSTLGACSNSHPLSDAIQPSYPLSAPSPPAFNPSQHRGLFQWVSSSHQRVKCLEFSFSISPSNEYSGLISFRMAWLDFLAVQGTLKSLIHLCSISAKYAWPEPN